MSHVNYPRVASDASLSLPKNILLICGLVLVTYKIKIVID